MVLQTSVVLWIPNMCLVLKFDNEKVVSVANEQTHPVPYYNIDVYDAKLEK